VDGTQVFTRLIGRFNAYNLLAAYGVATELGMAKDEVLIALSSLGAASGRLDYVTDPTGAITADDYSVSSVPVAIATGANALKWPASLLPCRIRPS
jgi:UDP-N-acetylmuramyl pentapeptide synthase